MKSKNHNYSFTASEKKFRSLYCKHPSRSGLVLNKSFKSHKRCVPLWLKAEILPIDLLYKCSFVSGIIGYPVGLTLGALGCALYHYLVRQRCARKGSYRPFQRPSSSSSKAPISPLGAPVSQTNIHPNIYRSGFTDETIFKTGEKMAEDSYLSGKRDWWKH